MDKKNLKGKIFPVRIDDAMHRELRKCAYLTEVPMSELIREGIKLKIEKIKKMLTNVDLNV